MVRLLPLASLEGTTNFLLNPSAETNLTSIFSSNSAALSRVATGATRGSFAVQVVTPGTLSAEGVLYQSATSLGGTASRSFTGSIDISGSGTLTARVDAVYTDGSRTTGNTSAFPAASLPQRRTSTVTTDGVKTLDRLEIWVYTISSIQAVTFYTDAAQVEQKSYATSYTQGTRNPRTGGLIRVGGA